jgi:predicted site-specific integrase-resolvase
MTMAEWIPINEAAQILGIHSRTLRRHVNDGKRESQIKDGKKLVLLEEDEIANGNAIDNDNGSASDNDHTDLIIEKDKRIEDLQAQVKTLENTLSDLQTRFDFVPQFRPKKALFNFFSICFHLPSLLV